LLDKHQLHCHSVLNRLLAYPKCLAREAIKNWTELQHSKTWLYLPGCKHGKLFIGRPCKKLKLDRHQLKLAVAILTGHAPVRGHLCIIGLFVGDPSCRFCEMETERVQHLACRCEALSRQRYNVFGVLFLEPKDLSTATVRDLCLFIRNTGLSKLG
jgi:hypothetical protein